MVRSWLCVPMITLCLLLTACGGGSEGSDAAEEAREPYQNMSGCIMEAEVLYSDGDLEIALCDNGEIVFSNTAVRLNEIEVGKLFDRFFTGDAARNFNGLGLAISKALVE